ncbi:MAG: metal-sulfur cluster assembly factor [Fuerstiella sp.]|nr:metal-sulfur cluster assembly factor [Fuerstiella sp.]
MSTDETDSAPANEDEPAAGLTASDSDVDKSTEDETSEAAETTPSTASDYLEALKQVIDPELMINIVDLGLIYTVEEDDENPCTVNVGMTLTSPACPAGPQLIQQSKMALERLHDVDNAVIRLEMSPPWTPERMTDDARDQLGIF